MQDDVGIYERAGANRNVCTESLRNLHRHDQRGDLPPLRVRLDARHHLARELVHGADYRVEIEGIQYYVAVDRRFVLRHSGSSYVAFEIPAQLLDESC